MMQIRKADERGHVNLGWLDSKHSFSFGEYYDPRHMGFRALRVINDDTVAPTAGFPTHPHRDMEIITYVLDGAVAHKDTIGNEAVIRAGDVQRMTAGTGIRHSEYNNSDNENARFLQIWVLPERQGLQPGYEQKYFDASEKRGTLRLVASPDGRDGSVEVHQDLRLYAAILEKGDAVTHAIDPGRHAWVQVARGTLMVNGETLETGDGAAITDQDTVTLATDERAEVLLFDLA